MSGSLNHTTTLSSKEILQRLYPANREVEYFTCEIKVASPREDSVEDGTLTLEIKCLNKKHWIFRIFDWYRLKGSPNGDRFYRTRARFKGDLEEFKVLIIIYSRQAEEVGATISMAENSVEIFQRFKAKRTER